MVIECIYSPFSETAGRSFADRAGFNGSSNENNDAVMTVSPMSSQLSCSCG